MHVSVEFLKPEDQHSIPDKPMPISTWKVEGIQQFPFRAIVQEIHETGMSVATGLRLRKKHDREVWISGQEGGFVQPCKDLTCWDQRRFGTKLFVTQHAKDNKGHHLTLLEVITETAF